ncbi:hypothetical protein Pmani_002790 [Petrolisthes manimaculis]|uniref:Uncharacterized protein n=1 Tax=Petrolisthes manimaculis TaxID=1843537 RepID=A0AAE1QJU3_9EUCA|nr:hypothetical protein Pmani_002790 [Petrolisthes manimaculis]
MSSSIELLKAQGESLGFQGEELSKFVLHQQAVERDERARERDKEREFQLAKLAAETELARVNSQVNVLDEVRTLHTNEPSSGTIAVVEDEPVDDQFPLAEAGDVSSGGKPIENSSLDWTQQTLRAAHQSPPTTQTLRAAHQSPPTTQRIFELLTSLDPSTLLSSTLPPTAIRVDDGTHLDSRRQTATAFRPRSILYFLSWLV